MSEQSLLAKLGLRLGTLGTLASIAVAAPLTTGDYAVAAATDATRMGWYFDRTAGAERIVFVAQGSRVASFGVLGLSINVVPVAGNGLVQIQFGATKAFGLSWDASTNLYPTATGVLVSDSTLNGLMPANSIKGNNTAGATTSIDMTGTQAQAVLPNFIASGASHAAGKVPDPGAIAGTGSFLRESATWNPISLLLTETATPITITDASETSIFGSFTVPANTLTTNGDMIRLLIEGTWVQASGVSATPQLKIKIGGVTVYDDVGGAVTTAPTNRRPVWIEIFITRITSTTATTIMRFNLGNASAATTGIGDMGSNNTYIGRTVSASASAWTWANDTTLEVTFKNSTAVSQTLIITSSQLVKLQ